ncbi:MAG: hypothetical protein KGY68_08185 [Candidatus Thermoplasmatota archaeon]|nr:hypothetical protein [Candidatus Thermoplasmatota archaeon]
MTLLIYIGILLLLVLLAYGFIYVAPVMIIVLAILTVLELLGYSLLGWLGIELPEVWILELMGLSELLIY